MSITHQEIVDRVEALGSEASAAYAAEKARIQKERESLQELCGSMGHVWGKSSSSWPTAGRLPRECLFCRMQEP